MAIVPLQRLVKALYERYRSHSRDSAPASSTSNPILVLVGAAASYWSGLVQWETLKQTLFEKAASSFRSDNVFVDAAWASLSPHIGPCPPGMTHEQKQTVLLSKATTEQICAVASQMEPPRQQIINELQKAYGARTAAEDDAGHRPQLAYEILAHLLRHRFIDDIVTFNFDESLDRVLDNELGPDGFDLIVSDQHPRREASSGSRLPRLIKLHGTVSAPASLRFTVGHTNSVPADTLRLLDETAFGTKSEGPVPDLGQQTHILSLGYGWNDTDIVQWTASRIDRIGAITVLRRKNEPPGLLARELGKDKDKIAVISALLNSSEKEASVDHFLWALWNILEARLIEEAVPFVPASRHFLLGHLFGPKLNKGQSSVDPAALLKNPDIFLNRHSKTTRFQVELFLHAVKTKGMTNLSVMSRFRRINRYMSNSDWAPPWLVPSNAVPVKETFFVSCKTPNDLADVLLKSKDIHSGLDIQLPVADLDTGHLRIDTIDAEPYLREQVTKIFNGPEIEIAPEADARSAWLFSGSTAISRYQELRSRTDALLRDSWTDLFVVAESGAWLCEDRMRDILKQRASKGNIFLIAASDEGFQQWQLWKNIRAELSTALGDLRDAGYEVYEALVPWWRHNRHFTLGLNLASCSCDYQFIYFRRRLKTSSIAPAYGSGKGCHEDWVELLIMFMGYARRACLRAKQRQDEGEQDFEYAQTLFSAVVRRLNNIKFLSNSKARVKVLMSQLRQGGA